MYSQALLTQCHILCLYTYYSRGSYMCFKKMYKKENNLDSDVYLLGIIIKNNEYQQKLFFTVQHIIFTQTYPVFMYGIPGFIYSTGQWFCTCYNFFFFLKVFHY